MTTDGFDPYEDTLVRFTNGEPADDFTLAFFKPHGPVGIGQEFDLHVPGGMRRAKVSDQFVESGKRVIEMTWTSIVKPTE